MKTVHSIMEYAAAEWPDLLAVSDEHISLTFSELKRITELYASHFKKRGIKHGDRVLLEAQNKVEIIPIIFGLLSVGASITPLHPASTEHQWNYIREKLTSDITIKYSSGQYQLHAERLITPLPELKKLLSEEIHNVSEIEIDISVISEDVALIIFSSGSTGKPKGITGLHRQVHFAAHAIHQALDYRLGDKIFLALPLSFDYGIYQIFLGLLSGASIHLVDPKLAGPTLIKELIKSRATVLPAVPQIINTLATFAPRKVEQLSHIRLITNTGEAVAQEKLNKIRGCLPNAHFQLMYGLTECKRVSINPVDEDLRRPNSSGKALPDTKISIVDENDHVLSHGHVGQIVVQGAHLMAGYWNADEMNVLRYKYENSTIRKLYTGDYGHMDEDGYLYIQGRKDDLFKNRGYRVSCIEIETTACEIDAVENAVLIKPQGDIKRMTLFYTGKIDSIALIDQLSSRLEGYKIPEKYIQLETIPINQNRKFDRNKLKQLACNK